MELDDELCLCFHVTKRKVVNFVRVTRPQRAGQLSECYGAGTGCGWCRVFLERIFREVGQGEQSGAAELSAAEYRQQRSRYVRAGGGTPPPGAAALEPDESPPEGGSDAAGSSQRT